MTTPPSAGHYSARAYDGRLRWMSYFHQVDLALDGEPAQVLEIGAGSGFISRYLRSIGVDVTTVDSDAERAPDRVGDVRALPFADDEYDTVLCAQVLEHLPREDFGAAIAELARVARRRVVLSLPQTGRALELTVRIPPLRRLALVWKLPSPRPFAYDGKHHWELGARNARLRDIRRELREKFEIEREFLAPENAYHRFYALRPR